MSEAWPAQVVKESGEMESDAAAEASHVAGKASEAVTGSAHAVQGAVSGVCQLPPPHSSVAPPANPNQSLAQPRPLFSHLICMHVL